MKKANLIKSHILHVFLAIKATNLASTAQAQDLNWQTVKIRGEGRAAICDESTVLPFYNFDTASFLFTSLGVDLPSDDFQYAREFGACQIRSRFVIPQGYVLTGLEQVISGGAIKSRGARGMFRSRIYLRMPPDPGRSDTPLFPVDRGIDPDGLGLVASAEKLFRPIEDGGGGDILTIDNKVTFGRPRQQYLCDLTRHRPLKVDAIWRVAVLGQRTRANQSILIQVDSVDNHFDVGLKLAPCRR